MLVIGVVAIAAALGVRNSRWVRENRLRKLSVDELALAIHDTPDDPLTFIYYGDALMKQGMLPESARAFDRAIQLDPKNVQAVIGRGSVYLHQEDLKKAVETFERAVKLAPNDAVAHFALAQAWYRAGSPRRAIEPLKTVVKLQPKHDNAWYLLGKMYGHDRQWDQAMDALQKAISIDPKNASYWRDLGQINANYTRLDEAEKQFKKAIELEPANAEAYYLLGLLYTQRADTPKMRGQAEQALQFALVRDDKLPEAYFELGKLYERSGNYAVAVNNFRKAQELNPGDEQALYHLGQCLVKLGNTAEGKKLIAGSQELGAAKTSMRDLQNRTIAEPQNRELRLRLARVYRKYGNDEGAMTEYRAFQGLGPRDKDVDREIEVYVAELKKQAAATSSHTHETR
jgi:tetratricopeptide (TPR) repeat protein